MINLGSVSYGSAALAFAALSFLLMTSWRGRLQGGLLMSVAALSCVWALLVAARSIGDVARAVIGLVLVEQLFRNTRTDKRWAIKYLCFGVGGLFAYDFFLYSDALLFKRLDLDLWQARGLINALIVPLIAVSAARNPEWSLDVFVSRRMVFLSAAVMAAGIYLLAMAAGGAYIRLYGGTWGSVVQAVFLFGAGLVLVVLLFSGQM